MFAGKALLSINAWGSAVSSSPQQYNQLAFKPNNQLRALIASVDAAALYRLMICELAFNAALGMKCIYSVIMVYPWTLLHSGGLMSGIF